MCTGLSLLFVAEHYRSKPLTNPSGGAASRYPRSKTVPFQNVVDDVVELVT